MMIKVKKEKKCGLLSNETQKAIRSDCIHFIQLPNFLPPGGKPQIYPKRAQNRDFRSRDQPPLPPFYLSIYDMRKIKLATGMRMRGDFPSKKRKKKEKTRESGMASVNSSHGQENFLEAEGRGGNGIYDSHAARKLVYGWQISSGNLGMI